MSEHPSHVVPIEVPREHFACFAAAAPFVVVSASFFQRPAQCFDFYSANPTGAGCLNFMRQANVRTNQHRNAARYRLEEAKSERVMMRRESKQGGACQCARLGISIQPAREHH